MTIETIEFAQCKQQLSKLTPILKNWCHLHSFYTQTRSEDAAYWYNERASISVLAAAAWQEKNWVALEEYSTRKINSDDNSDFAHAATDKAGRCDLFIGSKNGNAQFAIEAKQAWQAIGSRVSNPYMRLKEAMDLAWDDAGHLMLSEASKRLAVTFCAPSIHVKTLNAHRTRGEPLELLIEDWLKELRSMLSEGSVHGLAYSFPKITRGLKNSSGNRIFPGTVMLIKERKQGVRV